MLAPNKQNLLIAKRQATIYKNGLKLLKEKRTGLILTFLNFCKQGKTLENKLSKNIQAILSQYNQSLTFISSDSLLELLPSVPSTTVNFEKKRVSGVYVDNIDIKIKTPQRKELKPDIELILAKFSDFFPLLLQISQLKINAQRLAKEITKSNRQIQNIETKIVEISGQVKYISQSLSEQENLKKSTLIKIFK